MNKRLEDCKKNGHSFAHSGTIAPAPCKFAGRVPKMPPRHSRVAGAYPKLPTHFGRVAGAGSVSPAHANFYSYPLPILLHKVQRLSGVFWQIARRYSPLEVSEILDEDSLRYLGVTGDNTAFRREHVINPIRTKISVVLRLILVERSPQNG